MKELDAVLIAFHEGTHCEAAVWTQTETQSKPTNLARSGAGAETPDIFPEEPGEVVDALGGRMKITRLAGARRAWLALGPCDTGYTVEDRHIKLLLPVITQFMRSSL